MRRKKTIIYTDPLDLIFATCERVAKSRKIKLVRPHDVEPSVDLANFLQQIAEVSEIRLRKVNLKKLWWQTDGGPLLGFYANQPCALLPKRRGGYRLIDLTENRVITVTEEVAAQISASAYYFYPSLPVHIHGLKSLLRFALKTIKLEIGLFVGIQIFIGIFTLAVPVAAGYLFDVVVPNGDKQLLVEIIAILLVNVCIITLFTVCQSVALIRLRFKLESVLSPAIWDRILRFPSTIFRRFSAGDLSFRAGVISDIQNSLTQSSLISVVNGFMSIITLALLFYYSKNLAWAAVALAVIIALVTLLINYRQLHFMRRLYTHFGKFLSFVYEILSGIAKIRVANATGRIFHLWADRLAKRSMAERHVKHYLLGLEVFIAMMLVVNPLVLYGLVITLKDPISFGTFVAFNAAFSLFFMTLLKMSADISEAIRVIPLWERAKPLITSKLESGSGQVQPGELSGDIVVKHITFRYQEFEKPLFKDLSLEVHPGEFVAVVGPSGSGKSTLLRLLLGFERPEAGGIYYDGVNLKTLKLTGLRKQIGVVIQNSELIPGTILNNIIGGHAQLDRVDAWEIAEKVGLTELIKSLPMQMDTLISEGVITLSGGEAQRLILARALAAKPKILFLDEATSALDNTTQAVVHHYLKQLQATQIIVAHRLSTIINADKIYVLDKGAVVQMGTFTSLMAKPGLFAQLASRQL